MTAAGGRTEPCYCDSHQHLPSDHPRAGCLVKNCCLQTPATPTSEQPGDPMSAFSEAFTGWVAWWDKKYTRKKNGQDWMPMPSGEDAFRAGWSAALSAAAQVAREQCHDPKLGGHKLTWPCNIAITIEELRDGGGDETDQV